MVKNVIPHRWAGTISLHEAWKSVILCFCVVLQRTAFLNTKTYKSNIRKLPIRCNCVG